MKKERPIILTISMLVCGREDTTIRCLDSLEPLMREVPSELILVDTGCSEVFAERLKAYTDQIIPFSWCNDFSKARNVGLEHAHGEWFLYLDDDEWFVELDELIAFFQSGEYKKYHRANYIQRNFQDALLTYYSDSWVSRMIRIEEDTHFESKIHEYLYPARGLSKNLKAIANHTGYIFQTEEDKLRHFERNSVLLLDMIREEPKRLRWKVQLVQEYRGIKDWKNIYEFSRKCLEETKEINNPNDNRDIGTFYVGAVDGLLFMQEYDEAELLAQAGINDARMSQLCRAYLLLQMAVVCYRKERIAEAENSLKQYLSIYDYMQQNEEVWFAQQGVLLVEEAFDDISVKRAYSLLICCGLKKQDVTYLDMYYDKLGWENRVIYVCDDIPPMLFEAVETMPPEGTLLRMWRDGWHNSELQAQCIDRIEMQKENHPEAYCKYLEMIVRAGIKDDYTLYAGFVLGAQQGNVHVLCPLLQEIRYSNLDRILSAAIERLSVKELYFWEEQGLAVELVSEDRTALLRILVKQFLLFSEGMRLTFELLRGRLEDYGNLALDFCRHLYLPEIIEDCAELLPEFGQYAKVIRQALALESSDLREALAQYKTLVDMDSRFATTISAYMKMLRENLSAQEAGANELDQLKGKVMVEVFDLVKSHQFNEALAILGELKKVYPNDLPIAQTSLEIRIAMLREK